jgi:hypothetical protein
MRGDTVHVRMAPAFVVVLLVAALWAGTAAGADGPSHAALAARVARIQKVLPGWTFATTPASNAPCRSGVVLQEVDRLGTTFDSPATDPDPTHVAFVAAGWSSAALARRAAVMTPRRLACLRQQSQEAYAKYGHVKVTVRNQRPAWMSPAPANFLRAFTLEIRVGASRPLIYTYAHLVDRSDPRIGYQLEIAHESNEPRALIAKLLEAAER